MNINIVAQKFIMNAQKNGWNELPQLNETLREIQKAKIGNELNLAENKVFVLTSNDWTIVAVLTPKGRNITQINLKIRKYRLLNLL